MNAETGTPTKNFLKPISNSHIPLSFLFIWNTFRHYRSSLENHTRFQTEMTKIYTRFQTKTAENLPFRTAHTLYGLYEGVPPGPFSSKSDQRQCSPNNTKSNEENRLLEPML